MLACHFQAAHIPQPTFMFCPTHLNFHSLIVNYFNKYPPDAKSKLVVDIKKEAIRSSLLSRINDDVEVNEINHITTLPHYRLCFDDDDCSLVTLLYEHCNDHDALLDFLIEVHLKSYKLTEQMLRDNCTRNGNEATESTLFKAFLDYSIFFPVVDEDGKRVSLKPLSEYETPAWMNIDQHTLPIGDIVGQMLNYNLVRYVPELTNNIFDHLLANVTGRLHNAEDSIKTLDDLIEMLAYFVPKGTHLMLRYYNEERKNDPVAKFAKDCPLPKDMNCNEIDEDTSDECGHYCQMVSIGLNSQDVIQDVLSLAIEEVNQLRDFGPYSLLPWCTWQHKYEPCWVKIVNELGVCFASNNQGQPTFHSGMIRFHKYVLLLQG